MSTHSNSLPEKTSPSMAQDLSSTSRTSCETRSRTHQVSGPSPPAASSHPFEGRTFKFLNRSRWRIDVPLSLVQLQQTCVPCEARQVFSATCVEDPAGILGIGAEAVIKIKLQVHVSEKTKAYLKSSLAQQDYYLANGLDSREEALKSMGIISAQISAASNPVSEPNRDILRELKALRRFFDSECSSAPCLISMAQEKARAKLHAEAIIGGYVFAILMIKVPGSALNFGTYCKMSKSQRDEIREAFRRALTDVWACGVRPEDKALRNIVWDEAERKCYIVDFEDSYTFDTEKIVVPEFTDEEFESWNLDEEHAMRCRKWFGLPIGGDAIGESKT